MWSFLTFRKDDFSRYIFYDCFCVSVIFQVIKKHRVFLWKGYLVQIHLFLQLDQLSGGIVAVGGDFAVPAGFLDQVVGSAVIETVGFAVFVGEDGQTAGFVVGVGEGMAQCVGAFERQSVHCEFVGGLGAESVDVGGQPVEAVVFEGFVTAVGIVG